MSYLDSLYPTQALPGDARYAWWEAAPESDDDESSSTPDGGNNDDEYIESQRAASLFNCAQRLESAQREIHEQNLWAAQLYSNRELAAFDWGTGQLYRASLAPVSRTGENITVRVVDTLVSQIGKNRTKVKPQARGASFHLRNQIRLLDKFLYGEWQRNKAYALTKQMFRDSCIFGMGVIKVDVEMDPDHGDRVVYERVFPDEILVDQMEIVACGKIRHFYRRRALPIEVAAATYGVEEEELKELADQQASFSYLDYRPVGAGWIVVIEGYQLASGKSPGRWMVSTQKTVLDEGEWVHDWLPYVMYHINDPVSGFYPPSIVEQVLPYQIRLNEINEVIRDAQDVMARPRILVAEGSRVNPLEVDNVIGRFIKYTGIKPEAITWQAVGAELYGERDRLVKTCLEQFGLSNLATTVTPPAGARFDSSPAFREFNAIQDDRLSDPAQRFEEMFLTLAETTIKMIVAKGANPKTHWYSGYKKSKMETIEWSEIGLEMDSFMMTLEPTSIYSMSPAAARDELEKQLAMGLISPEQYRLELADPDEESEYSLQAAAAEDVRRVIDLLESGEYENPIPEQDLVNGVQMVTLAMLNLNKYEDVPEETKMNFVNWLTEAKAIMNKGTETASMPPDAGAPPPPGMGQAGSGMGLPPGPSAIPVPEAAGLAPAGPGPMPNIS